MFILQIDASEMATVATLCQECEGMEQSIAFTSKKLNTTEKKYSTIERECLAIKCAVNYFCYYLIGREFKLVTDHAPLQWLNKTKNYNAQIT